MKKHNILKQQRPYYQLILSVLLMILAMGIFAGAPKARAATGFSLNTATKTIQQNSNFNVAVKLSSSEPVLTIGVCIEYPQDKLQFVNIDYTGSVFDSSAPGNSKCTIYFERFSISAVSGSNLHVANLTFKMLASSGTATINFDKFTEANGPPKLSLTNSDLTVTGAPVQAPQNNSSTPTTSSSASSSSSTKKTNTAGSVNAGITKTEPTSQASLNEQAPPSEATDNGVREEPLVINTATNKRKITFVIIVTTAGVLTTITGTVLVIKNKRRLKIQNISGQIAQNPVNKPVVTQNSSGGIGINEGNNTMTELK